MSRVFVAGLMHEANAFSPIDTPANAFHAAPYGDCDLRPGAWFGYGDLITAVRAAGDQAVPGPYFMATPSAPCDAQTFAAHISALLDDLARQAPVDAVLLFLHGAQTASGETDCAGALTAQVRDAVGPTCPVGVLLDLHANVTPRLLDAATLVAACKEYPHTDFLHVAGELWSAVKVRQDRPAARSWRPVPAFPASTTTHGPMKAFVEHLRQVQDAAAVISVSALHGFPHADVREASAGVLVYAETQDCADATARQLSEIFFDAIIASAHTSPGLSLEQALDTVRAGASRPLLIAERSDNPGAGGAGDATHLLHGLRDTTPVKAAVGLLHDPDAVQRAIAVGEGGTVEVLLGGKANALSGRPFPMTARVQCVRTDVVQPVFEGSASQALGASVLLEQDGLYVVANTIRQQPFSPEVFSAHGLNIRELDVVVVKSTNHFYNSFAPLVAHVVYCDAPGAATEDLSALPYRSLTRPVWPLDDEAACRTFMRQAALNVESAVH